MVTGLRKLKVKPKSGRVRWNGVPNLDHTLHLVEFNWSEIQDAFKRLSEDEQNELFDYFNGVVDGVGDVLFGEDKQDYNQKMLGLNDEEQKAFHEAVKESELFDRYC